MRHSGRVAATAPDVPRRAGRVAGAREGLRELCVYPGYGRKNSGCHGGAQDNFQDLDLSG